MAWFLLARALFIVAVTYAAVVSRPFSPMLGVNLSIGAALGLLIVWIEARLRDAEVTDLFGALTGRSARNICEGFGTARRPVPVISNTPSSLTAPKRFFTARTTR